MQDAQHEFTGLERELETFVAENAALIEDGLTFVARQKTVDVGRVDIEASDRNGHTVILELKVNRAEEADLVQLARYVGWYRKEGYRTARGILVAPQFSEEVRCAALSLDHIHLIGYTTTFSFNTV